jgi:hypothetical protein
MDMTTENGFALDRKGIPYNSDEDSAPDQPDQQAPPREEPPSAWERQPGENARQFEYFCAYRDMLASERSLLNLHRLYHRNSIKTASKKTGNFRSIAEWSRRNNWVERAEAYDDEKDRIKRATWKSNEEAMAQRHIAVAKAMVNKVVHELSAGHIVPGNPHELVRWFETATRVETTASQLLTGSGSSRALHEIAEMFEHKVLGPNAPVDDV